MQPLGSSLSGRDITKFDAWETELGGGVKGEKKEYIEKEQTVQAENELPLSLSSSLGR